LQSFPIVFPFLCFILPWIHLYDSSVTTPPTAANVNGVAGSPAGNDVTTARHSQFLVHSPLKNPHKDKTKPKPKHKAADRIKYYFTAPVTKFYFSMVGILTELAVAVDFVDFSTVSGLMQLFETFLHTFLMLRLFSLGIGGRVFWFNVARAQL